MAETEVISTSAEQTHALGREVGKILEPGDLLLLEGPFGSGKTVFVQGLAEGLGVPGRITSPSFVLMTEHQGRLPLVHVDLFRIPKPDDDLIASLDEYVQAGWVAAVEWPHWLPSELAGPATRVRFEQVGKNRRRLLASSPQQRIAQALEAAVGAG